MIRKRDDVKRGVAAIFEGMGPTKSDEAGVATANDALRSADDGGHGVSSFASTIEKESVANQEPACRRRPGTAPDGKVKATYYLDQTLVTEMKHLAVDLRKKDSDMVAEGIQEIIKKYNRTYFV